MKLEHFKNRKVGILGYGREGAATLRVLLERVPGCEVELWVEGDAPDTPVPVRAGRFDDGVLDFDILIRSPGIPILHPALEMFRASGRDIVNPTSIWLAERPDVKVIAVTGSKGKSTTAALLAHVLSDAGRRLLLAGNIGVPVLNHLDTRADLAVLELSSYQLSDLQGRLDLGVMTRLFPEHGDWHGGVEHYYASKLRMIDLLEGKPLLINAADPVLREATACANHRELVNEDPLTHREGGRLVRAGQTLLDESEWSLLGRHNLDNAALVIEAAESLGVDAPTAADALRTFQPLAHRLEVVTVDARRRRWINDSIATTPHATLAALQALNEASVVLIAGGYVRPADWAVVLEYCRSRPLAGMVVLPDSGREIAAHFLASDQACFGRIEAAKDINEAVALANVMAGPEQVILLSPGAASFPQFRDFEHRGESFKQALKSL
jgi:UDP-N-acetylmuramoylalanine--D-glutamate ligase